MTSRSKKYNYNINASGDFATNNLNLGVANMFSGSFSASNSVVTPTDVTGLSFNSVAVRSFQCQMTVTIDRTIGGSLYETFTIEGHQTASGWGLYITSLGDITGVTFTITSVGQVRYTSTTVANFVSSMFRFTVTQITNSGTYASLNSSTGGTYLLNSVQITNTVASVLGTDPGALYVLGGSTFEKAITIKTTDNAIGLGTGGGLSIFGGAAVSKDLLVGGNLGIGTTTPSTTLDITGTARVSGVISAGTMVGTTFTGGTLALSGSITAANIVTPGTVSAGTSVVTTRTGGTLALSGSITVANIVTPGTVSAGTSVVTTRTGGTLALSGSITAANIVTPGTVSAGTMVGTTFTGGALALSGSITAPSVIATTVSAGTSVVTTRTGGSMALSGSITVPSVIATTVSAGTSVVTTRTGGTLALSGSITAANIVTPGTVSAGTMVGTTFTGGSMALSGSITAANIVIPSTLRATGTSNTIANIFTTAGNVGIGLTTPTSLLHVRGASGLRLTSILGNTDARPNLSTAVGSYEIRGSSASGDTQDDGFLRLSAGGGSSPLGTQSCIDISGYSTIADMNNNIRFVTGGTERVRITQAGNVGIGLTTPTQQFQVSGNIGVENGYFEGLNESNNITGNTEWTLIRARNGAGIWGYKGASNHQGSLIFKTHSLFNTPVERLRITESGGVGIGTSSPEYMLDVNTLNVAFRTGLTGGWRTQWNYSGSTGETTFFNYRGGGTGGIWFKNLNTSNQDVGWSNVICGSITSNPRTTYGAGNVNGLVLYNGQYDGSGDSTSILFDHSTGGFSQNRGSGITSICPSGTYGQVVDMYFSTGASGVYSEKMRIQGNGNVGIGTSSPSSRLSVNGNINLSSYGQRVGFDVESDWWNYNGNVVGHYSLGWYGGIFGSPATAVLSGYQGVVLASEGIPRFTVRRDGRIGIATTAPVTTLHANGTTLISNGILHARDYGDDGRHCIMFGSGEWGKNFGITSAFSMRYYSNGADGTHAYTTIATYRASTYGGGVGMDTRISTTGTFTDFLFLSGEHRIGINTVPSYELHLNSDSAAKPNGGTWTTASDRRLKTGITMANLSICYDNIKAIPLKRYTWRDDVYTHEQVADRSKLGWIAQDVETVIPKAVDQKTMYGIEDCRSLNSDQIIATLYGCVQKLIEKVEDLETKQTETDTVIQKLRAKFPGEF